MAGKLCNLLICPLHTAGEDPLISERLGLSYRRVHVTVHVVLGGQSIRRDLNPDCSCDLLDESLVSFGDFRRVLDVFPCDDLRLLDRILLSTLLRVHLIELGWAGTWRHLDH